MFRLQIGDVAVLHRMMVSVGDFCSGLAIVTTVLDDQTHHLQISFAPAEALQHRCCC